MNLLIQIQKIILGNHYGGLVPPLSLIITNNKETIMPIAFKIGKLVQKTLNNSKKVKPAIKSTLTEIKTEFKHGMASQRNKG